MIQWKPVYVITMVQSCTDNINWLITKVKLTTHVKWKRVYVITMVQSSTDNINWLITIVKLTIHINWKPLNVITIDVISCLLILYFTCTITVDCYIKVTVYSYHLVNVISLSLYLNNDTKYYCTLRKGVTLTFWSH